MDPRYASASKKSTPPLVLAVVTNISYVGSPCKYVAGVGIGLYILFCGDFQVRSTLIIGFDGQKISFEGQLSH